MHRLNINIVFFTALFQIFILITSIVKYIRFQTLLPSQTMSESFLDRIGKGGLAAAVLLILDLGAAHVHHAAALAAPEHHEQNADQAGCITYKEYESKGKTVRIPNVLLPVYHTTAAAQIEVTIDEEGNFLGAEQVSQEDKLTVIPVTEKSGSRTSGKEPHPLCDNIQYLAGDYKLYVNAEGKSRKGDENCHEAYMDALEAWHISEFTHPKVDAIFSYLQKGTLVKDLITWKVLLLDENGRLDSKVKIQTAEQTKALVRFVVRTGQATDHQPEECWKDTSLQRSFVEYYRSQQKQKDLDYLTGEYMATSYLHSKKIRNEGDGSKLISSNDETYFTFRGRFDSKEQAFSIGAETSQKIHNALKWIIRKQGKTYDGMTVVCWENLRTQQRLGMALR